MADAGVEDTYFHILATYFTTVIYTFHMPAFFVLSGAIFGREMKINKYRNLAALLKRKTRRLMVPFVLVFIFYTVPIKWISGYYSSDTPHIIDILAQLWNPYRMHLWYLEALFGCIVIVYLLERYCGRLYLKIAVILLMWVSGYYISMKGIQPLGNPFLYVAWFEYGIYYEDFYEKIAGRTTGVIIAYLVLLIIRIKLYSGFIVQQMLLPFLAIHIFWYFSVAVSDRMEKYRRQIVWWSGYTFGIYLYSEPVNYLVLYLFYQMKGIQYFGTESGALIIYFSRFIFSLSAGIFITWFLKFIKSKTVYWRNL